METARVLAVSRDGGGQVEVGSVEKFTDIILLPPWRCGEHVASEQT